MCVLPCPPTPILKRNPYENMLKSKNVFLKENIVKLFVVKCFLFNTSNFSFLHICLKLFFMRFLLDCDLVMKEKLFTNNVNVVITIV